jgi:hypothetical protein
MDVKRTERGWAGHLCVAADCLFRRNTLLECGDVALVVSTIGGYIPQHTCHPQDIGWNRAYETMAFHVAVNGPYKDADVHRQVSFDSEWALPFNGQPDIDILANDMHEAVVAELTNKMAAGHKFEQEEE